MTSQIRRNKNNGREAQLRTNKVVVSEFNDFQIISSLDEFTSGKQIKCRAMGLPGEDQPMSLAARKDLPVSIETKYGRGWAKLVEAIRQAESNCGSYQPIVAIWPAQSRRGFGVVDLRELMRLYHVDKQMRELKNGSEESK